MSKWEASSRVLLCLAIAIVYSKAFVPLHAFEVNTP
jgi:hypothetical protein